MRDHGKRLLVALYLFAMVFSAGYVVGLVVLKGVAFYLYYWFGAVLLFHCCYQRKELESVIAAVAANLPKPRFLRVWELASFILDHTTREKVYEPAAEELREDYLVARRRFRTRWARRWLTFAFAFRTGILLAACFRNMIGAAALLILSMWFPAPLRTAVKRLLRLG